MRDLNVVVVLAALRDCDLRAGWRAVVAGNVVRSDPRMGVGERNLTNEFGQRLYSTSRLPPCPSGQTARQRGQRASGSEC